MVKEQLNILNGHDGSELQKMLNGKWIQEICKEFGSRGFIKVPLPPPLDRFIIPIALDWHISEMEQVPTDNNNYFVLVCGLVRE